MKKILDNLPLEYKENIEKAVKLLKEEGCREVYLFGSLAEGEASEKSDIDIAVKGCPEGEFFRIYGKLLSKLDYPVDLVNLDKDRDFAEHLENKGALLNVS